jgi:hypothetical protein
MVLLGASCLVLTQVSVDGSFLGGLFLGLLIFGLGMGAAFVAGSIASLAGVAEQHSGAASGLQTPPSTSAPRSGSRSCRRSPSRGPTTSSQPPASRPRRRSRRPRATSPHSPRRPGSPSWS